MAGSNLRPYPIKPTPEAATSEEVKPSADLSEPPDDAQGLALPVSNQGEQPSIPRQPLELPVGKNNLENVYEGVKHLDPEKASQVVPIAQKTGKPESFVDQHLDEIKKASAAPSPSFLGYLEKTYPGTSQYLSDPRHMAMVHDDLNNLAEHEQAIQNYSTLKNYSGAAASGVNSFLSSLAKLPAAAVDFTQLPGNIMAKFGIDPMGGAVLGIPQFAKPAMPTLSGMVTGKQPGPQYAAAPDWLRHNAVGRFFQENATFTQQPTQNQEVLESIKKGNWVPLKTQVVAGLPQMLSLLAGPEAGIGLMAGAQGAEANEKALQSGATPIQASTDAAGQAVVNMLSMRLGTMPILKRWGESIANSPGGMQTIRNLAHSLVHNSAVGTAQGFATSLGNDLTDYISGANPTAMDGWFQRALSNATVMAGTSVALGAPGVAHGLLTKAGEVVKQGMATTDADQAKQALTDLAQVASKSKLGQRAPGVHGDFVDSVAKGSPMENVYLPIEAAERYFQSKKIDPAAAAHEMGVEDSYREAKATGGDIKIPLSTWLGLSKTEHGAALLDDVKLDPDAMSVNQAKEKHAQITEQMKQEVSTAPQAEPADKFDFNKVGKEIYKDVAGQLEAAGERKSPAVIFRKFFETMGQRMGWSPEQTLEKFKQYGIKVFGPGQGSKALADLLKARFQNSPPETKESLYYHDPLTGALNQRAFEALPPNPEKPNVGHVSIEGTKFVNDQLGHEAGNDLYRYAAEALKKHAPETSKVGGDFAIHVKDQAELDQLLAKASADLPRKMNLGGKTFDTGNLQLTGAVGKDLNEAALNHVELKQGQEAAGLRAARGQEPAGFKAVEGEEAPKAVTSKARINEALKTALNAKTAETAAHEAHVDPQTGMLNEESRNAVPRKAFQASIDLNGLKQINDVFGHENGNALIKEFADTVRLLAKEKGLEKELDLFHLHGDEFWAQHNDKATLKDFWVEAERRLADTVITFKHGEYEIGFKGVQFGAGIGETDAIAEQRLKIGKARSKENTGEQRRPVRQAGEGTWRPEEAKVQGSDLPRPSGIESGDEPAGNRSGAQEGLPGTTGNAADAGGNEPLSFSQRDISQQVNSPEFKKWFGNSKIVDDHGKPLVVFRAVKAEKDIAIGVRFFSKTVDYPNSLIEVRNGKGSIAPVFLSIKKPLIVEMSARDFSDPAKEKDFIEKAKNYGNDGVIFKDPEGEEFYVTLKPEQVKSSISNSGTFSELNPDILRQTSNRGRVDITPEGQFKIFLSNAKDASTIFHEGAHTFLFMLKDMAEDPAAPQDIKDDYQAVLKWFGAKDWKDVKRAHHEMFAEAFEEKIRLGTLPTFSLRRLFDRFRDWLTNLYGKAVDRGVSLPKEISEVFDRMLASKEEIERAQHEAGFFNTAIPEAPPDLQKHMKALQEHARQLAEDILLKPQMEELTAKHQELLKKERERLTHEAEKSVAEIPVFQAESDLREKLGQPDLAKAVDRFLSEKSNLAESAAFEEVAERNGYGTGAELARDLQDARATNRRQEEIERRVSEGMAKHDPQRISPEIREQAMKAIHQEKMTELLAMEKEILESLVSGARIERTEISRARRFTAADAARFARETARQMLDVKGFKDAGNSRQYITAERNAAVKAAEAMSRKDYATAADFKRKQMLNHALASEAIKNKAEIDKAMKYLQPFANRGQDLKGMPYGFARQVDQLLKQFGMATPDPEQSGALEQIAMEMAGNHESPDEIANATGFKQNDQGQWVMETLPEFVDRVNNDYFNLTVPADLFTAQKTMKTLTLADLRSLRDAVKSVVHTGKGIDKFFSEGIKEGIKQAGSMLRESIEEKIGTPYAENMRIGSKYDKAWKEKVDALAAIPDNAIPSLVNVLTVARFVDAAEDGPFHEFVYRMMTHAEAEELRRKQVMLPAVNDLMAKFYDPKELSKYKEIRTKFDFLQNADGTPGRYLTKEQVLMTALNWGNEGNRQRIKAGFGVGDDQVYRVLDTLDKKDWDFVQATWDHLQTYWPEIVKHEMKIRGLEPKAVEPSQVVTRHGVYSGGYFPIGYDYEKSSEAYKNAEQRTELFKQYSAAAAHTENGFTKARVNAVSRPVRLSMDVLYNHLEDVVHDLSFRGPVIDLARFLRNKDTRIALENSIGVRATKGINDWLKNVASPQGEVLSGADRMFRNLRAGLTFSQLGFRAVMTPILAGSNSINIVRDIGPVAYGRAMKDFAINPKATKEFVDNLSPRMAKRYMMRDRDLMDLATKWKGKDVPYHLFAFITENLGDMATSYPLWSEVYKRAIPEHGDMKARDLADEAVTKAVGSGSKLDQVGVQRGGEAKKMFSMFYSWGSMMFQRAWLAGKISGLEYRHGNTGKAIGVLATSALFGWVLQAMNENLWREVFHNATEPNDQDRKKRMLGRFLKQPFGYMWITRDLAGYGFDRALGEHAQGLSMTPLEESFQNLLNPLADGAKIALTQGKPFDQRYAEEVARAASSMAGYPQLFNSWTFNFMDWLNDHGEASWKDLVARRTKH